MVSAEPAIDAVASACSASIACLTVHGMPRLDSVAASRQPAPSA
jgi:hypothetical protein